MPEDRATLMEGLAVFAASLVLVTLLEIGDKTQLVTISLATRYPWTPILAGAIAGLLATTAVGAAIGGVLATALTTWITAIQIGGGILFLALGTWTLLQRVARRKSGEETIATPRAERGAFAEAFAVNFVAEFGDKTQIAVIVLAATNNAPLSVFAGAGLGLALVAVSSVLIGMGLAKVLKRTWLDLVSAALFLSAGVLLILEALGVL